MLLHVREILPQLSAYFLHRISIADIGGEPDDLKQFLSSLDLAVNLTLHPLNSSEVRIVAFCGSTVP